MGWGLSLEEKGRGGQVWSVLMVRPTLCLFKLHPPALAELPGVIPVFSACLLLLLCTAHVIVPSQASQSLPCWMGSVRGCPWVTWLTWVPGSPSLLPLRDTTSPAPAAAAAVPCSRLGHPKEQPQPQLHIWRWDGHRNHGIVEWLGQEGP